MIPRTVRLSFNYSILSGKVFLERFQHLYLQLRRIPARVLRPGERGVPDHLQNRDWVLRRGPRQARCLLQGQPHGEGEGLLQPRPGPGARPLVRGRAGVGGEVRGPQHLARAPRRARTRRLRQGDQSPVPALHPHPRRQEARGRDLGRADCRDVQQPGHHQERGGRKEGERGG